MILPAWTTRSWRRPTRAGFTGLVSSSGGRSKRFSRGLTAKKALPKRCPTAKRARRCSSAHARAAPGAICLRSTGPGTPFTCVGAALVDAGVPERAAQAILAARQRAGDFDPALALLDSTLVRAHQHAAGAQKKSGGAQPALGRSRGGLSTKIHLVALDERTALAISLSAGQANDAPPGEQFVAEGNHPRRADPGALCGPRLRQRLAASRVGSGAHAQAGGHPAAGEPACAVRLRQGRLPPTQPGRALGRPPQAVPGRGHALR